MSVRYGPSEYKELVRKNRERQTEFLSGERFELVHKMFDIKGRTVRTAKSYVHKLLIEIGLQTLRLKPVKKGKTANGYPKITVSFYKDSIPSWYNNSDLGYDTIDCTHLLLGKKDKSFKSSWFRPFTMSFNEQDFKVLNKIKDVKCVVAHKEEPFIQNGQQMKYRQGRNIGKPIILLRPEIVKVYPIDTPDEDIEINYFDLYKPLK